MIEQSEEYCDIGRARMDWWQNKMQETGLSEPKDILKNSKSGKKLNRKLAQNKLL